MKIKTVAAGLATAVALGVGAFASAGAVSADPQRDDIWLPGDPPGQNPFGPPGQVKKAPTPLYNVPPGHWGDPVQAGLPPFWLPPLDLVPPGYPLPGSPLPVVWNPGNSTFGVWLGDGLFIAIPMP